MSALPGPEALPRPASRPKTRGKEEGPGARRRGAPGGAWQRGDTPGGETGEAGLVGGMFRRGVTEKAVAPPPPTRQPEGAPEAGLRPAIQMKRFIYKASIHLQPARRRRLQQVAEAAPGSGGGGRARRVLSGPGQARSKGTGPGRPDPGQRSAGLEKAARSQLPGVRPGSAPPQLCS